MKFILEKNAINLYDWWLSKSYAIKAQKKFSCIATVVLQFNIYANISSADKLKLPYMFR